jgi:hypothetical protein
MRDAPMEFCRFGKCLVDMDRVMVAGKICVTADELVVDHLRKADGLTNLEVLGFWNNVIFGRNGFGHNTTPGYT